MGFSVHTISRKQLITVVWIIFLALTCLILNLQWNPVFQYLVSDSGVYAYMGSAIARGQVPYRDVMQGQPPVGFYLDALAIIIFGQTPWAIWWINVIWIILSTALFFIILKRMFSLAASMLASLIFTVAVMLPNLFMGGNLMEVFGLLPQVLIIGATFSFFSTKQNRWIAIIGFLAGISFMTKQTTIALGIASFISILVFTFLWREWNSLWKRLVFYGVGVAIPIGVTTLFFSLASAFNQYLSGVFLYSLGYVGVGAPFLWSIKNTFLNAFPKLFISKLYYIAAATVLVYLLENYQRFLKLFFPHRGENSRAIEVFPAVEVTMLAVFLTLPIELVFTSLGGRNLGHYFISLIPATVTAVGYIFWKMFLFIRDSQINFKTSRTWSGLVSILLSLFSLYWLVIALSGEIPTKTHLASISSIFSQKYEMSDLQKFILANTEPVDPVLVWHIHLDNNFITDRRPPQRVIFPGELFLSNGEEQTLLAEFIDQLETNPPKLIIIQERSSIGLPFVNVPVEDMCPQGACLPEMASAMKSPETILELQRLREYFLENYVLDTQIYDWLIYKRIQ